MPYVFKKLFSKEPIVFEDTCETMSVTSSLYLDMNETLPDVSAYEKEYAALWKEISDMTKPQDTIMEQKCNRVEELTELISKGHDYHFVGKVGSFCPIEPGYGGGELLREAKDKDGNIKYAAATGTKGYRWLESETVKVLGKGDDIDLSYYNKMVDVAVEAISQYGDFEMFVSDDNAAPWGSPSEPWSGTTPFDVR